MPFKSLTDLAMRINPQMKKNRYVSTLNRKRGYTPGYYWFIPSILIGGKNEKLP